MKSLRQSVNDILLSEASSLPTTPKKTPFSYFRPKTPVLEDGSGPGDLNPDPAASGDDTSTPAPAAKVPPKTKSTDKPKYVATVTKDGTNSVALLSKDQLEDLINQTGASNITQLFELGKEVKVPTVKV